MCKLIFSALVCFYAELSFKEPVWQEGEILQYFKYCFVLCVLTDDDEWSSNYLFSDFKVWLVYS